MRLEVNTKFNVGDMVKGQSGTIYEVKSIQVEFNSIYKLFYFLKDINHTTTKLCPEDTIECKVMITEVKDF